MRDAWEIRRDRLGDLLKERSWTQAKLADEIGCSANYISFLLATPPRKRMGERFARRVEKALELPRGWLDTQPGEVREGPQQYVLSQDAIQLAKKWQLLCAPFRNQIVSLVDTMGQHYSGNAVTKKTKRKAA